MRWIDGLSKALASIRVLRPASGPSAPDWPAL